MSSYSFVEHYHPIKLLEDFLDKKTELSHDNSVHFAKPSSVLREGLYISGLQTFGTILNGKFHFLLGNQLAVSI